MFWLYLLDPSGPICHSKPLFLCWFCLNDLSIDVSEVLKYPTIIVLLLIIFFMFVINCFMYLFGCSQVGFINIYNLYIFLLDCIVYDHTVSFVPFYSPCMKVYFVDITCYSGYLFTSICMIDVSLSLHFQSAYVLRSEMSLWQAACRWVLLFYPFCHHVPWLEHLVHVHSK